MEKSNETYMHALATVENNISSTLTNMQLPTTDNAPVLSISSSNLDAWDYCYSIAIGLAGVFIATNESFAQYLDQIHKSASSASGDYDRFQSFLGNALHHKGDHIDAIELPFKNRNGNNAYALFHRLLWGHDIFSVGDDNPFFLMINQQGLSGILQAVRHLLADTMSKQGLPLPGSSFFDVVEGNGKTSNYLIHIAQQLSNESTGTKTSAQEIYSHMMTIRAQDVTAGVVVKFVTELYFLIRKIEDDIRRAEIRLIAYAVNFFGEAALGCVKQNGVPYINIPLAGAMATSFAQFCYYNNRELRSIAAKTEDLHAKVDEIEETINKNPLILPTVTSAEEYISLSANVDSNVDELLDFFRKEIQ